MLPFQKPKSREPQINDLAMEDLARMLLNCPDNPISGAELLDSSRFDYSEHSLVSMDQFLEQMRSRRPDGKQLVDFVLRCGGYVGEVIRRNSLPGKEWHWLDFDQAILVSKEIKSLGRSLGSACVLWDTKSGFVFPLAKVVKYLQNGAGDSTKYFAHVVISDAKLD